MRGEDTQFSAEYAYERRKEGASRLAAIGLIVLYALFAVAYFLLCYISGWIPLFAVSPILIAILVYFTWTRFFPDCYFEFRQGTLCLGYEVGKRRVRREKLRIHIKDADRIYHIGAGRVDLPDNIRVYDMSSSVTSAERVCIVWDGGSRAVIFDTTPALSRLLVSHSERADELAEHIKKSK